MSRFTEHNRTAMKFQIALSGVLLLAMTTVAQAKLKVYVSVDMEGVGGVSTWQVQALPDGREYQQFRRLLTEEVNAAIAGAFDAGATEVLVADSHGDAQNLDVELLDRRAHLIRAWPRPLLTMAGIDSSFDAALLIGYHAGAGEPDAILSHTMSSKRFFQMKLNGKPASEAVFSAATAGDFGVPIAFLSGDQTAGKEARDDIGAIQTVAVKQATGFFSATMMHPEESRRLIRDGVREALQDKAGRKPFKLTSPVQLELTLKDTVAAELLSYLPQVTRKGGNTIVFTAQNMTEVAKFLNVVLFYNTL
jgi:D-amino peptidase